MDILVIGPGGEALAARLRSLGFTVAVADDLPAGEGRAAPLVILDRPAPGTLATRLTALARHPGFADSVVLVHDDAVDDGLHRRCGLSGAIPLEAGAAPRDLAARIRLAARLQGEIGRRRALEADKCRLEEERAALRSLAPFGAGGEILGADTGRYRAQRLLAKGAATIVLLAVDDFEHWRRGFGVDAARATEVAVTGLLAACPARLGDMLHSRGAGQGWGLWLSGTDRAEASLVTRRLLDRVCDAGLLHAPARPDTRVSLSAGIAVAPAQSAARKAEETAEAALHLAASLGGNRIRWAD